MPAVRAETQLNQSWSPMIIIATAQILMVFNVSSLQVSIDGIVSSFNIPATMIGTAIVTYSLVVAGLIMLGARVGQIYGSRRVFRTAVALFGTAMLLMALSGGLVTLLLAQAIAGLAAAALVPSLVVLVADHYKGSQKEKALAWLAGAQAIAVVLAFLIAGSLSTWLGWRYTFGLLAALAAAIYTFSDNLNAVKGMADVSIDWVGVGLASGAVFLISIGANKLADWGPLLAAPAAPFSIVDMSPAPIMVVCGIFLIQAFFVWSRKTDSSGKTALIALEVVNTSEERSAIVSIFAIGALGSAITFLIPLYLQIVQGRTGFQTAVVVIPFSLSSFIAAVLVVRLYDHISPRRMARYAFLVVSAGVALLGIVIRNDWSTFIVVVAMMISGLGEGMLITLLFNVLVTASPRRLAGDVGSIRGTTNNLAAGVGTALASTLIVGVLGTSLHRDLVHNPVIPVELKREFNLNNVPFIGNDQLRRALASTSATPEQTMEAVGINSDARLVALKVSFFTLAGFALLAFFPAAGLSGYIRRETSGDNTAAQGEHNR